jgi:hypothetical protein
LTYLAVSTTSDPTGTWNIYTVENNSTTGDVTDQPMTGVCNDKVVMGWDDFTSSGFADSQAVVIQKSALLSGAAANADAFFSTAEFRPVPAQSLSLTSTCWMAVNFADPALGGSSTSPTLNVIAITGTPDANNVSLAETDVPIAPTSPPPDPRQPSGITNDTANDDRLISAVWQNGVLWTSATDACTPSGDTTTRNCMRLIAVNAASPTTLSVRSDEDLGSNGLDEYYPAVSLDSSGNLFVSYTASSSTQFPGAFAVISPDSGARFTAPLTIQAGSASYNGGTAARWGDYSAAAPDPSLPGSVWVAGEYAPSDAGSGDWGTAAAQVLLPTAYTPLGPVRVLDTRNGTGGHTGAVGPNSAISLQVTGADGVPLSGVTAVVLNVTAVSPTAAGYVTVYPDGQARPTASNLNFTAGETIPNLVIVPVGSDGKVDFYNHTGSVNLVADLAGYYTN